MTYQVLARKWRPKTFSDMAGQEHVLQTLIHALDHNRLHHAYLFTGTRGVGKTTIARIFAKCLNCEEGVTSTPCGKCSACLEIAEGRFIDLIEVDAASKTKVEDTRELLENVQYAPSRGRYKVYLIDEVHMLSTHSFNALLKTLEEPPPHIVFLLATTDPHKLPITILSRCLQFSLKNLSPRKIVDYLRSVLIAEQIPFEEGALWHLAKGAQGSMRDALTLLDQSISFCAGNVREAEVSELLGTPDQALLIRIIQALKEENAADLLDCASAVAERAFDYFLFLENLLSLLHRLAIAQLVPGGVDNSQGDREQILALARELTAEDIQLFYQIALNGRQDLANAHDPRMAFEMLLLRMLVFAPQAPEETTQSVASDSPDSEKKKTELEITQEPESEPEPASEQVAVTTPVVEPAQIVESTPAMMKVAVLTPQSWIALVEELSVAGITGNLLANCVPDAQDESSLSLVLDESQSALFNDEHLRRITQCLSSHFGREMNVTIAIGRLQVESPAQRRQRMKEERVQEAIQNFEKDENVQAILQHFSAHIQQGSISIANEVKS